MLMMAPLSHAQKAGTWTESFEAPIASNSIKFQAFEWNIDFGYYCTNWLAVFAKLDTSRGLFNLNNVKTFHVSNALGGGLSFNVFRSSSDLGVVAIRTYCGTTLGNMDWKYTYYSCGVYLNAGDGRLKPSMGLGVKYYDAYKKSNIDNYLCFYFSFGFVIN